MPSFNDTALIINSRNLGEADRIITLLTRYHGKISAVAKGVRKISSKKGGNLDLINHVDIKIVKTKSDLGLVTEAGVINSFEEIKKDLDRIGESYYICELLNEFVPEGKNTLTIYNLSLATFKKMTAIPVQKGNTSMLREQIKNFEIELLKLSGFWSDNMFAQKKPQTLSEWRRFNRIFIEQILGKQLKAPLFIKSL